MYDTHIMVEVSNETTPEQLASWVRPEDRVPLLLALSLYKKPRAELGGFRLVDHKTRVAVWKNSEGVLVIGCRGTSPFSNQGHFDLVDDANIAKSDFCNLTLVNTASQLIDKYAAEATAIIFAGHSLGGTSAMCLTGKFQSLAIPVRGIGFNAGASPTNPILTGPGPQKFRMYHIFGDLISSHMGPQAAEIIRIKKKDGHFGGLYPHSSSRILASDGPFSFSTADEEDQAFKDWGLNYRPGMEVLVPGAAVGKFLSYLLRSKYAEKSPIPGSTRSQNSIKNV